MYMTETEICTLYRKGGCTATQIEILADLNACPLSQIIAVLADHGYTIDKKYEYMLEDETLYIRSKPYKRPLTMSHLEWYNYKQKVKDMQVEQEHYMCKVAEISHKLEGEIEFIKCETWKGEYL